MISDLQPGEVVLPAYAGMFLSIKIYVLTIDGSPRVCGDVSGVAYALVVPRWFSPRMRGCFYEFLKKHSGLPSSPRVCGDVSFSSVG